MIRQAVTISDISLFMFAIAAFASSGHARTLPFTLQTTLAACMWDTGGALIAKIWQKTAIIQNKTPTPCD